MTEAVIEMHRQMCEPGRGLRKRRNQRESSMGEKGKEKGKWRRKTRKDGKKKGK